MHPPFLKSAPRRPGPAAWTLGSLVVSALLGCGVGGMQPGVTPAYQAQWLSHDQAGASTINSAWVRSNGIREARLAGDDSQLLVEARLNGRVSGIFLLDTGATYCVITPDTARRLGIPESPHDESIALATPAGQIEAQMMNLSSVEVARAEAGDVPTVIYPAVEAPLSGILGLSFLRQFEFSVDAQRRVLRLRPF